VTTEQQIDSYTAAITDACRRVGMRLREPEFAKSFARDYGFGLASCGASRERAQKQCQGTYGSILVISTGLRPPLDMKDWVKSVMEGFGSYEPQTG